MRRSSRKTTPVSYYGNMHGPRTPVRNQQTTPGTSRATPARRVTPARRATPVRGTTPSRKATPASNSFSKATTPNRQNITNSLQADVTRFNLADPDTV